jgi:Fic family protein
MTRSRGVDRLRRKKQQLDRLRPLSPRSLAALAAWYDVELTYSSNAIEGNTLTRSETAIVLEKGLTIGGKPLKDHLEAIGHRATRSPSCARSPPPGSHCARSTSAKSTG